MSARISYDPSRAPADSTMDDVLLLRKTHAPNQILKARVRAHGIHVEVDLHPDPSNADAICSPAAAISCSERDRASSLGESVDPATYSITRKSTPSCVSKS